MANNGRDNKKVNLRLLTNTTNGGICVRTRTISTNQFICHTPKDKPGQRHERRQRGIGFVVDGTSLPLSATGQLRWTAGSFGAVMRTDDHRNTETLFAVVDAPAAQGVIGDASSVIQEERPFFFSFFTHTRHSRASCHYNSFRWVSLSSDQISACRSFSSVTSSA